MHILEVNEGCTITSQPCICLYLLYQTHTINMVQSFPSKNKDMVPSFLWHPHFEWPSLMWTYAVANKDYGDSVQSITTILGNSFSIFKK